ncbi:MAG TPA: DMT family transporter [Terriglobales bacterium]|nr:DMT family transporter [Terriglobales bacterium]
MLGAPSQASTGFALGAVFAWGTSDFVGGYAVRRANAFVLTAIAHASGGLLMAGFALGLHASFPPRASVEWALAAGALGGVSLALFYRALASGSMGLLAPLAAVISAGIPAGFGILTEGWPGVIPILGFLLAGLGIWLISRTDDTGRPKGLALTLLAGLGFAGFFLCVKQAGEASALWIATLSRSASLLFTGTIAVLASDLREITVSGIGWGIFAGCVDVSGTAFFVRATQTGRLDTAVVLSSLYPAVTVLLAWLILREHFTRWKAIGIFAAMLAVPLIAMQ